MNTNPQITVRPSYNSDDKRSGWDVFVGTEWHDRTDRKVDALKVARGLKSKSKTAEMLSLGKSNTRRLKVLRIDSEFLAGLVLREVTFHRNGIGGREFAAVRFHDCVNQCELIATVVERRGTGAPTLEEDPVCVINPFNLEQSWRGESYEPWLRARIKEAR